MLLILWSDTAGLIRVQSEVARRGVHVGQLLHQVSKCADRVSTRTRIRWRVRIFPLLRPDSKGYSIQWPNPPGSCGREADTTTFPSGFRQSIWNNRISSPAGFLSLWLLHLRSANLNQEIQLWRFIRDLSETICRTALLTWDTSLYHVSVGSPQEGLWIMAIKSAN